MRIQLKPIFERYPPSVLQKREDDYIKHNGQIYFSNNLPAPNKDLSLTVVVPVLNEEF